MSAEDIDGLDDVENSLLYYNQAIIHYHMRQYSEAIYIGERLYQFLEPFGMFLVFKVTSSLFMTSSVLCEERPHPALSFFFFFFLSCSIHFKYLLSC